MAGCFAVPANQRTSRKSSDMHLKLNVVLCLKKVVPGLCYLQAVQASKRVRGEGREGREMEQKRRESIALCRDPSLGQIKSNVDG